MIVHFVWMIVISSQAHFGCINFNALCAWILLANGNLVLGIEIKFQIECHNIETKEKSMLLYKYSNKSYFKSIHLMSNKIYEYLGKQKNLDWNAFYDLK